MNDKITIILIIITIILLISTIFLLFKNNQLKKNLTMIQIKQKKLEETFQYDKDFEYLQKVIDEKCSYYYTLELKPRMSNRDRNMINDEFLNATVIKVNIAVKNCLSENYLDILSKYNNDIENYITEKIYITLLMLCVDVNKKVVGSLL